MASPAAWKQISIKVDLLRVAPIYVDFIQRTLEKKCITEEPVIRRLLHRYEHYWMPLLAEWQQTDLEPPRDVEWMWQLHVLHQAEYSDYCKERFGRILPHAIRMQPEAAHDAVNRTKLIWRDNFPDEPYDLDIETAGIEQTQENGTKLSHLMDFSNEQLNFFHQIGLPHYKDSSFLFTAVDRYKQLLLFKKSRPDLTLCLPYDIQLIWRVHLLHPFEYQQEMNRIFGDSLPHLGTPHVDTVEIIRGDCSDAWRLVLGTELFAPGTGPRGPRITKDLVRIPKESYSSAVVEEAEIIINDLVVSDLWTPTTKIVTEARKLKDSMQSYDQIFHVKGTPKQKISSKDANGLGKFSFDARANRGIEFHVFSISKRCCTKQENHISTIFFNPRQAFPNMSFVTQSLEVDIPKISYTDCEISFLMKVKAGTLKPHLFSLQRETFFGATLPTDLRPFVISLPSWYGALALVEHDDKTEFLVAKHSLTSKRSGSAATFGCQIVKQEDLDLTAVLLYKGNDTLTTVAFSIGADQLPTQAQLSSSCPLYFESSADEQAMMIRNYSGDWAIIVAKWIPDADSPAEGQVTFHVYYLQEACRVDKFDVRDDEHSTIRLANGCTVDLPTGRVTVDSRSQMLPEDLTLVFCMGALFVTCQKKPMSIVPGGASSGIPGSRQGNGESEHVVLEPSRGTSRFNKKNAKSKKMSRKRKMSASFTYLLACGLQIDAALYGSVGPSLASSRASSFSNLIKSASQASLPTAEPAVVAPPSTDPVPDLALAAATEPSITGSITFTSDKNSSVTADSPGDNAEQDKPEKPEDTPQNYMDVRL